MYNSKERLSWQTQAIMIIVLVISLMMPFYITVVVFAVELFILALTGMLKTPIQTTHICLWLFILYTILISLYYQNIAGALVGLAFALFMLYFSYYTEQVNPDIIENIMTLSLIASFFLFIFSVFEHQHILGEWDYSFIHPGINQNHHNRVEATFANPNYYAMMLEFFIIFGVYKGRRTSNVSHKIIIFILIMLNIIAIYFTGNRTSYAVIIASLFVFYYIAGYKKQAVSLAVAISAVILWLTSEGIIPRMENLLFATKDRMEIWIASLKGIRDNWLTGQGPLTYMQVFMNYTDNHTQHAHNIYLDLLLSYGVIGCALLVQPVVKYAKLLNDMRKHPELRERLALIVGLIAVVLVHGITDVTILWVQTGGLFLLIILAAPNMLKESNTQHIIERRHTYDYHKTDPVKR